MPKVRLQRLGSLQVRILKVLWEQSEATVAEVHGAVASKDQLAYTTIATMLRKMETRGLVRHHVEGRTFVYRAAVTEEEVSQTMAEDLLQRLFHGSLASMVDHLLTRREVSAEELARLEKLIAERKRRKS